MLTATLVNNDQIYTPAYLPSPTAERSTGLEMGGCLDEVANGKIYAPTQTRILAVQPVASLNILFRNGQFLSTQRAGLRLYGKSKANAMIGRA
jgi:hypothetical protein